MNAAATCVNDSRRRRHQRLHFCPDVRRTSRGAARPRVCRAFLLVTSSALLDELDEKLRDKFEVSAADAGFIRAKLEQVCELVSVSESLSIIKDDPDDDRVLECAVAGRADCIVSGDRHLLRLGSYEGVTICTVRQFFDRISLAT
jgi:putative PIN family toxin of toxin-antitoxin system